MINNDDFARWTNEQIAEDMENGKANNVLRICENNYDLWTKEYFPLLQLQGKSCYRAVVAILHKGGCHNANEDMVRSYFAYIRKKRGIKKSSSRVPLNQVQPSLDVATAVVTSPTPGAAPIVPPSVTPAIVTPLLTPEQVGYRSAAAMLPPPDSEEFNINEELERLNEEAKSDFKEPISSRDVQLLHYFDKIRQTYPLMQTMINADGAQMAGDMIDMNVKDLFSTIKMKFRTHGKKFAI